MSYVAYMDPNYANIFLVFLKEAFTDYYINFERFFDPFVDK